MATRQRRFKMTKVKSHATDDAIEKGEIEPWACCVNELADAAAATGAEGHQVSVLLHMEVSTVDTKAWMVQQRSVEAAMAAVQRQSAPRQGFRKARLALRAYKLRLSNIRYQQAVRVSSHVIKKVKGKITRIKCLAKSSKADSLAWTCKPCETIRPPGIHHSHCLGRVHGLHVCWSCGAHGWKKLRSLAKPCPRIAQRTGRLALAMLREKPPRRPHGVKVWPDELD